MFNIIIISSYNIETIGYLKGLISFLRISYLLLLFINLVLLRASCLNYNYYLIGNSDTLKISHFYYIFNIKTVSISRLFYNSISHRS